MAGITDLQQLLSSMQPHLVEEEFVFCTLAGRVDEYLHWQPVATFCEQEGLSLVIHKQTALENHIEFENTYRQITLTVHSSLDAVGLTAAVSAKLASHGISANVIAAFYHDHIFVQSCHAETALTLLSNW